MEKVRRKKKGRGVAGWPPPLSRCSDVTSSKPIRHLATTPVFLRPFVLSLSLSFYLYPGVHCDSYHSFICVSFMATAPVLNRGYTSCSKAIEITTQDVLMARYSGGCQLFVGFFFFLMRKYQRRVSAHRLEVNGFLCRTGK